MGGRTTCNRNTALCIIVHRAAIIMLHMHFISIDVNELTWHFATFLHQQIVHRVEKRPTQHMSQEVGTRQPLGSCELRHCVVSHCCADLGVGEGQNANVKARVTEPEVRISVIFSVLQQFVLCILLCFIYVLFAFNNNNNNNNNNTTIYKAP